MQRNGGSALVRAPTFPRTVFLHVEEMGNETTLYKHLEGNSSNPKRADVEKQPQLGALVSFPVYALAKFKRAATVPAFFMP